MLGMRKKRGGFAGQPVAEKADPFMRGAIDKRKAFRHACRKGAEPGQAECAIIDRVGDDVEAHRPETCRPRAAYGWRRSPAASALRLWLDRFHSVAGVFRRRARFFLHLDAVRRKAHVHQQPFRQRGFRVGAGVAEMAGAAERKMRACG